MSTGEIEEQFISVMEDRPPLFAVAERGPVLCSNIHTSMSTLQRSTLTTLTECAHFQIVSVVPLRILRGALTGNYDRDCSHGSSPAINTPL